MRQQLPTWLAVAIVVVVVVVIAVGYWVVSTRTKTVQPPEFFQPGKTAQFVPQQQGIK